MSDEETTSPHHEKPGDTEPPESGPDLVTSIFDLFDTVTAEIEKSRKPDPTRRPKEVWIRWRTLDIGPNAIELIGCTEKPLDLPLGENEFEGRFR